MKHYEEIDWGLKGVDLLILFLFILVSLSVGLLFYAIFSF